MSSARVTITVPADLVQAADRRARVLGRSRSWVFSEALRTHLGAGAVGTTVHEPAAVYAVGLGPSRRAQLQADLALTPEERVEAAERTALVSTLRRRTGARQQVLTFDRLEDFMAWERREALDP
jgi:hypothetical protein